MHLGLCRSRYPVSTVLKITLGANRNLRIGTNNGIGKSYVLATLD
jgi:hypothetical protein